MFDINCYKLLLLYDGYKLPRILSKYDAHQSNVIDHASAAAPCLFCALVWLAWVLPRMGMAGRVNFILFRLQLHGAVFLLLFSVFYKQYIHLHDCQ